MASGSSARISVGPKGTVKVFNNCGKARVFSAEEWDEKLYFGEELSVIINDVCEDMCSCCENVFSCDCAW